VDEFLERLKTTAGGVVMIVYLLTKIAVSVARTALMPE
jgi:hypothetical protein